MRTKKKEVLNNAENLYNKLYYIYKDKYDEEISNLNKKDRKNFDYKKLRLTDYQYESENEEEQQSGKKPTKTDVHEMYELIIRKETDINRKLLEHYFDFQVPSAMLKTLYNLNDETKNNLLVNKIKSELSDLKEETENISKEEKEIENIDGTVDIVEKILEFNKLNQQGEGLKILTPNQMLSRLTISLAQFKAGNNAKSY